MTGSVDMCIGGCVCVGVYVRVCMCMYVYVYICMDGWMEGQVGGRLWIHRELNGGIYPL